MKGISEALSHSIFLLISLAAMGVIIAGISSSFSGTEKTLTSLELNYVADAITSEIMKIYSVANSSSQHMTGNFKIPVAEKIGSKKFYIEINDNILSVTENVKNEIIEARRSINIDANVSGTAYLPAFFELEKTGEGVSIRLVE